MENQDQQKPLQNGVDYGVEKPAGQVPNGDEPTPQQRKRRVWPIVLLIIICLLLACAGAYYFLSLQNVREDEEAAYRILERNEQAADYEAFLERYPDSPYADDVRERLSRVLQMDSVWRELCVRGDRAAFSNFKNHYRSIKYGALCDLKIDSLDWIAAQQENTAEAYERYVRLHPEGRYLSEASVASSTIQQNEVSDEDQIMIATVLNGFYKALGDNDTEGVCRFIPPVMDTFLSKKNATKADVIQIIARMYNEHIQTCKFTVNDDYEMSKQPYGDGSTVFKVSFSVDQNITRDNEGKTFGSFTAEAILNQQFRIFSLTMKEISRQ